MITDWEDGLKVKQKEIRIDVGADVHAPTAAQWLHDDDNCFVIIVEPVSENYHNLFEGQLKSRHLNGGESLYLRHKDYSILKRGTVVKKYNPERVLIINAAISNISYKPVKRPFYIFGDGGSSSLLSPLPKVTKGCSITTENIITYSLEYILDKIGVSKDTNITHVKTDTQGTDFDVVKSLGKYLSQVASIKCEWNTWGQYTYESLEQQNGEIFTEFMKNQGFEYVGANEADVLYHNVKKYSPNVQELQEFQLRLRDEQFNKILNYFNFSGAE
jgi:hypothetical protein